MDITDDIHKYIIMYLDPESIVCYSLTCKEINKLLTIELWARRSYVSIKDFIQNIMINKKQLTHKERCLELLALQGEYHIGSDRYVPIEKIYRNALISNNRELLKYTEKNVDDNAIIDAAWKIAIMKDDISKIEMLPGSYKLSKNIQLKMGMYATIKFLNKFLTTTGMRVTNNKLDYVIEGAVIKNRSDILRFFCKYDENCKTRVYSSIFKYNLSNELDLDLKHIEELWTAINNHSLSTNDKIPIVYTSQYRISIIFRIISERKSNLYSLILELPHEVFDYIWNNDAVDIIDLTLRVIELYLSTECFIKPPIKIITNFYKRNILREYIVEQLLICGHISLVKNLFNIALPMKISIKVFSRISANEFCRKYVPELLLFK